jgi:hypothetical protein
VHVDVPSVPPIAVTSSLNVGDRSNACSIARESAGLLPRTLGEPFTCLSACVHDGDANTNVNAIQPPNLPICRPLCRGAETAPDKDAESRWEMSQPRNHSLSVSPDLPRGLHDELQLQPLLVFS